MSPWDILGIETTEDERAIKRAYSKLLLVHRPDGDQAAFQRLRWAYETALQQARLKNQAAAQQKADFAKLPQAFVPKPPATDMPEAASRPARSTRQPLALETLPLPEPAAAAQPLEHLRSAEEVTQHLIAAAAGMRDDPARYAALLAAEPELFNLDTKLAVSVQLARALTKGSVFPDSLIPVIAKLFEWDTFAEQRRLGHAGIDGNKLYALMAGLELQLYVAAAPAKGGDKDRVRRWLKILKQYNATPARWSLGMLSLFWRKNIIHALQLGIQRFGRPALEQFLGPKPYRYWTQLYGSIPNLTQGTTHLGRILVLAAAGSIFTALLDTRFGEDYPWIAVLTFVSWSGSVLVSWYFAAWLLKAMGYGIGGVLVPFIGRQVGRLGLRKRFDLLVLDRMRRLNLDRRWRFQLAVALVLPAAAWFWPAYVSGGWYMLTVLLLIVLSLPDRVEFMALLVLAFTCGISASQFGPPGRVFPFIWPLSCLYMMWACRWFYRWLRTRWTFEIPNSPGMVLLGSGIAFVVTVACLGYFGQ